MSVMNSMPNLITLRQKLLSAINMMPFIYSGSQDRKPYLAKNLFGPSHIKACQQDLILLFSILLPPVLQLGHLVVALILDQRVPERPET